MLKHQRRMWVTILLIGDLIVTNLAFILAYYIRFNLKIIPVTKGVPDISQYLKLLPFISIIWPITFYFRKLYQPPREKSRIDDLFSIFVAATLATVITWGFTLYYRTYYQFQPGVTPLEYSRLVIAIFLALDIILVYSFRMLMRYILEEARRRGLYIKKVLIAGAGDLGRLIVDRIIYHSELGLKVIGFLDDDPARLHSDYKGIGVTGKLSDFPQLIKHQRVDQLFIALPLRAHKKMLELIKVANREGIDVRLIPDLLEYIAIKAGVEELDGIPIINLTAIPLEGLKVLVKRVIDVMVAAIGLLLFLPLFPFIALAVKLSSPGPVFYKQQRMGLDGKPFSIYKFRSMFVDAEQRTGPVWAKEDDPRRTKVGKFLRRLSLDELPQLFNVLKGEMSLVGPRPERPQFVEEFKEKIPQYMLRHKVKSGITGWAQVNGWRGDTSLNKRIEYDLYYIENWSLGFDLKILWLTLWNGLTQKNAY